MPIHSFLVHLPLGLAAISPFVCAVFFYLIQIKKFDPKIWAIPAAILTLIALSAFAAILSGEQSEEQVEKIVPSEVIEEHEDAAWFFLSISACGAALSFLPFLPTIGRRPGRALAAMTGTLLLSIGVLSAAVVTGHRGGEIIFTHNGAKAFQMK